VCVLLFDIALHSASLCIFVLLNIFPQSYVVYLRCIVRQGSRNKFKDIFFTLWQCSVSSHVML